MPNWNYNDVKVFALEEEVREFIVQDNGEDRFNMSKTFPDKFPISDPTGEKGWDYNWACENTGSKWFP